MLLSVAPSSSLPLLSVPPAVGLLEGMAQLVPAVAPDALRAAGGRQVLLAARQLRYQRRDALRHRHRDVRAMAPGVSTHTGWSRRYTNWTVLSRGREGSGRCEPLQ